MIYARVVLAALILSGCLSEGAPPSLVAPDPVATNPPSSSMTSLWGMVVENSGVCIAGATVSVVRGQGLGQSAAQNTPCGAWDYGGGFVFNGLTPGVEMTLRVIAPGYVQKDTTVVPTSGPQMALLITPSRE